MLRNEKEGPSQNENLGLRLIALTFGTWPVWDGDNEPKKNSWEKDSQDPETQILFPVYRREVVMRVACCCRPTWGLIAESDMTQSSFLAMFSCRTAILSGKEISLQHTGTMISVSEISVDPHLSEAHFKRLPHVTVDMWHTYILHSHAALHPVDACQMLIKMRYRKKWWSDHSLNNHSEKAKSDTDVCGTL